jgi:PTH1 family peptidyl-tRNA hydrolase
MKLIIGLGNPGEKYESTRHNVGFMVIEHLLKDLESVKESNWSTDKKLKSQINVLSYDTGGSVEKVILAKPDTFMNNSGMAVSLLKEYYKVNSEDMWVIHDELDLPLGSMKIRLGGSAAGHHGIENIIEAIGTDKFWRFRMGIGQSKGHDEIAKHQFNATEFVLKPFSGSDKSKARAMFKRGSKALQAALEKGIESAQNQFNTK